MGLIIDIKELQKLTQSWHDQGLRVVLTNGCFDLLHVGHLRTFRIAKQMGDLLIVGINNDQSIKMQKGDARPIINEIDRSQLVAALEPVDYVVIFSEKTADCLLNTVKPHIYVKGVDYNPNNLPEQNTITNLGIQVKFVPLVDGISTTEIISRIKRAYPEGGSNH